MTTAQTTPQPAAKISFDPGVEVKWCPGCGDYSILTALYKVLPDLGIPREKHVFVSGIGCSGRLPYYINTFGFHTIHGRAPAVATGVKLANPDLTVWIATGDGDSLSIGGNHFMHLMRRNLDIKVLLFNNQVYGLTKGQTSPTSPTGTVSKSTPVGSVDQPARPIEIALASGASFAARVLAIDMKGMMEVIKAAVAHKGTALIEILQNCTVFNDGAFEQIGDRAKREQNQLVLKDGEPLLFGAGKSKGIALDQMRPTIVEATGATPPIKHDVSNRLQAMMLSSLELPDFPTPLGILYKQERPTFEEASVQQTQSEVSKKGKGTMHDLLHAGDVWDVK